jgi:hypothetical protein
MENNQRINIMLCLFLLLECSSYGQTLKNIQVSHKIATKGIDTVCFVSSMENKELQNEYGLSYFFLMKEESTFKILDNTYFTDSYIIDYLIEDFDNDGENEVLIINADESYYSAVVKKLQSRNNTYKVVTVFNMNNIDTYQYSSSRAIDRYITIDKQSNSIIGLKFRTIGPGGVKFIYVKYDPAQKKFLIK